MCVGEGGLDLEQTGLMSSGDQMLLLPEEDLLTEQMESLACKSTGLIQNISHARSNLVCEIPATGRRLAQREGSREYKRPWGEAGGSTSALLRCQGSQEPLPGIEAWMTYVGRDERQH